jgi:tetratricopeptide (TPR) repeat protein
MTRLLYMRLRLQFAFLILLAGSPAFAQMARVSLQIVIMREGGKMPLQEPVTVTVLNDWGDMVRSQETTQGFVVVDVRPGLYRLTISGAGIETYLGDVKVDATPSWSETVYVRPKKTAVAAKASAQPVPAIRLKIPRKARDEYSKAEAALAKNDAETARSHLNRAIALYPDYDLAYFALGRLEMAAGHPDLAQTDFQYAVKLNDAFGDAHRELAKIFLADKDYAAAEPALLAALRSDPGDLWTLSFTALTELKLGKFDDALGYVSRVHSTKHSGYASVHLIAGQSLESLHRPEEAAAEYRQYLAEEPYGSNAARARQGLERLGAIQKSRLLQRECTRQFRKLCSD